MWALGATGAVIPVVPTQEIIQKAADGYFDRGVLGLTCILLLILLAIAGLVIRHLYRDLKALNAGMSASNKEMADALREFSDGADRDREVLQGFNRTLETRSQTLSDLVNLVTLNGQEIRHGFGNTSFALEGILKALREPKQLAASLSQMMRDILPSRRPGGSL